MLDATAFVSICGYRHLAERLGCFALPLTGTQVSDPSPKIDPERRRRFLRCRDLTLHRQKGLFFAKRQLGSGLTGKKGLRPRSTAGRRRRILNARRWRRILIDYSTPSRVRSVAELAITALPLVVLWAAAWFAFRLGHAWASLLIAIPAAGFLVRLFMIQHDCGHGAFFAGRLANDWVGRVIGVLTLTPYDCWRRTHAIHHATTGNLDRRGIGDLDTLTVREYRALSGGAVCNTGFTATRWSCSGSGRPICFCCSSGCRSA